MARDTSHEQVHSRADSNKPNFRWIGIPVRELPLLDPASFNANSIARAAAGLDLSPSSSLPLEALGSPLRAVSPQAIARREPTASSSGGAVGGDYGGEAAALGEALSPAVDGAARGRRGGRKRTGNLRRKFTETVGVAEGEAGAGEDAAAAGGGGGGDGDASDDDESGDESGVDAGDADGADADGLASAGPGRDDDIEVQVFSFFNVCRT